MLIDLLAQFAPPTTTDASSIASDGAAVAAATSAAMNQLWTDVLGGVLYQAIAKLGQFFAVGTLLLWLVQFYKDMVDGNESKALSDQIWTILVIFLLSNQGAVLSSCTLQLREVINGVDQSILTNTSSSIQLQQAFQQAMDKDAALDNAKAITAQCSTITDPTQQQACMQDAVQNAQAMTPPGTQIGNFLQSINPFNIQNYVSLALRGWLATLGVAFQWVIEISMLLTGLLGPIAVGLSLMPVGAKAIYAWLIGFFTVGFTKLCYNIIVGLVATLVLNSNSTDTLIFPFVVGLIAPILALAISAGGGMAVFNSITSLSMSIATYGINAATGGVGTVVGRATSGAVERGMLPPGEE